MAFEARHGVHPHEKVESQPFEVDVELGLDLWPAGRFDDLSRTVDYGTVYEAVRAILEGPSHDLIESLAESVAQAVLEAHPPVREVVVRVRKPGVQLGGPLAFAGVEIRRRR
ncbi:MAG: dihydroneopterin aldolase [Chloroflexi bacterium]|nr:dihydroneopterin aldolase [Chloroflexota bacterium]